MKGLFIINPSSGKQNIDSMLREIMATLILDQICSHVDVFYTKGKDDAKNRAAELKPGDYDFIVSVGGDGTLNEVTNGLILSESNIPMAIISAGTVNDFATYMKLPQTADGFCQMIKDFQTKKVDVGRVNNEYFINVLAAGMLTDIAYKVPKDKKAVLGKMAYYLEGVKEFPKQLSQNMTLTFNSKEYSGTEDIMLFLVANSKSVGGFADAAPLASVSDGYLDVMIIKKMALLTEAPDLIFKLFQGEHPKHPSIEYFQTKELSVLPTEQTAGIAIDYDGEILEEVLDSSLQTLSWQSDVRKPYAMARLINIRKTLRLLSFKDFKERTIRITDPILKENNGCFKMNFHHGSVKLDKIENQEDVDFDVSIGELTAHIFGYKEIPNFPTVCKKDSFFINDYV